MPRIVVELTDRCNLACRHCFSGRHGGSEHLSLDLISAILGEAKACGFDSLSFTGGEPTVHPEFPRIIRLTHEAGYRYGFVTNGWTLPLLIPQIVAFREGLSSVTISLDGAAEATHDRLRGAGAFRRAMAAVASCAGHDLPFAFNMVVCSANRREIEELVETAAALGARGVRFEHLMHNPTTTKMGFDLTPQERKATEARIWRLQQTAPIAVAMGPGHYTTSLFPCAPLNELEVNVDCRGNLTKCCHLSGHGDGAGDGDVAGSLREMSFADGLRRLRAANQELHRHKMDRLAGGEMLDSDYFPCWYCVQYFRKADWLRDQVDHPWSPLMWPTTETGGDGSVKPPS